MPGSRIGGSLRRSVSIGRSGRSGSFSRPSSARAWWDGAFGVSEVGVGAHAVGRGAEGAAVVVWGDVVAVAVGLDGRDSTFPGCAGDVVLGAGAEDGGDVGGGLDLGCDNELALGVPVARAELFFECA
jgi:hypothetical protein